MSFYPSVNIHEFKQILKIKMLRMDIQTFATLHHKNHTRNCLTKFDNVVCIFHVFSQVFSSYFYPLEELYYVSSISNPNNWALLFWTLPNLNQVLNGCISVHEMKVIFPFFVKFDLASVFHIAPLLMSLCSFLFYLSKKSNNLSIFFSGMLQISLVKIGVKSQTYF